MQNKKVHDDSRKLEKESFRSESFEDHLITRRRALSAAGVAALGVAGAAVLGPRVTAAGAVLGSGMTTVARGSDRLAPTHRSPSTGIFTYSLPSALGIDVTHETVTLPLHKGLTSDGQETWYIVTDSSDQTDATQRGVNYSGKLLNVLNTSAVQNGSLDGQTLSFDGTVNFGLTRVLVPDPVNGFPPLQFAPGAMGDAKYSPLVHLVNDNNQDLVMNAPQVANETGVSASVVDIDFRRRTVTLAVLAGWVDGQFTMYLRTDASSPLVAAIERSTYAPGLEAAPGIANDEPPSARAAIIPIVNGIRGDSDPMRQGLQSALLGEGDPFNVAQEQPSDPVHYTPVWDVTAAMWTDAAIAAGNRVQLHSQDDVRLEALAGNIVSAMPGAPNAGLGGINAIGAISNCPIMVVFPGRDYD